MSKKVDSKGLVQKIDQLIKQKMAQEKVVSLDQFRQLRSQQKTQTLLIIEDDETMRGAMRKIFESEGYSVKTAADGSQLGSVLEDAVIDLIILDVGLPWINGFELASLMKQDRTLNQIPLIFVSAQVSDEDVKRGFEVGADDYIKKPFDVQRIQKVVKTLLNEVPKKPS